MFKGDDVNSTDRRSDMTKEDKQATIGALVEERRGYEVRGLDDRVAEVDRQLAALGAKAETTQKRSSKRPAARKGVSKR